MNTSHEPARSQSTSTIDCAVIAVGPEDRAALCDLFRRSSVETRYARFHHMVADFPHHYLVDLTCIRCPHLALAARLPDGDMIGLASAAIACPETAEVAVWGPRRLAAPPRRHHPCHRIAAPPRRRRTGISHRNHLGHQHQRTHDHRELSPHATTRQLDLATLEVAIPLRPRDSKARASNTGFRGTGTSV